jgi:uncharacterized protein YukE
MTIPIIRVTTEILHVSSEKISNLGGQISSSVSELSRALDGIHGAYDGQLESAVGSRVAQAQGAGNNVASRVGESSADLARRASAFDAADSAALGSVLGISTSLTDLRTNDPAIGSWADLRKFPLDLLQLLLSGMAFLPGIGLVKLIVDRMPSLRGLIGWNGATFTSLRWPWETAAPASPVLRPSGTTSFPATASNLQYQKDEFFNKLTSEYTPGMTPTTSLVVAPWTAINPGLTSKDDPYGRDPRFYSSVIYQFGVANNDRYSWQSGKTYCNIFVSDVTGAMGVPIPHRWDAKTQTGVYDGTGTEMQVPEMREWLNGEEGRATWSKTTADEAQNAANKGIPAIVLDTGGRHIAMIRPGEIDPTKGPATAQAGATNFDDKNMTDGFGGISMDYKDSTQFEYYVAYKAGL